MRTAGTALLTSFALLLVALAIAETSELLMSDARHRVPAAVLSGSVFSLTNDQRIERNLPALERNALLDEAAQMKAQDMAGKGYYAHVSPDGVTPMHWVEKAGYRYLIIGENLVVNRTDAEQVVDAFMGSPGHRANILRSDFTEIGVGVANGTYKGKEATFAVQIFATPYPQREVPKKVVPKPVVEPVVVPSKPAVVPKAPTPVSVPRAVVVAPVVPKATTITQVVNPLQRDVQRLISPILSSIQNASTSASTTATTTVPEVPLFFLETNPPIELVGVSRLEANSLPVQVGSNWTMEFRVFVDSMYKKTQTLFKMFES